MSRWLLAFIVVPGLLVCMVTLREVWPSSGPRRPASGARTPPSRFGRRGWRRCPESGSGLGVDPPALPVPSLGAQVVGHVLETRRLFQGELGPEHFKNADLERHSG